MQEKVKVLVRKRIMQKLENIFVYPLSIVHAPMGYGKTTAVQQFFAVQTRAVDVAWVSLANSGGSPGYLWEHLLQALPDGPVRKILVRQGLPDDAEERMQLADALAGCVLERPLAVVLDDFQNMEEPSVFSMIKLIVQRRLHGLSIVLITRNLSKLDAAGLYQKQLCFTMTEKALRFTADEIGRYFAAAGCVLSETETEWLSRYTEGWISMLYVLLKNAQRGLPVGKSNTINDIIEQNLYEPLDKTYREILCRLSFLDSFTVSMALYVLHDPQASFPLQSLIKQGTFIVYNEWDKSYRIRNLLREFLTEHARFAGMDFRACYRRADEWYLREKCYADAFEYLYRAGEVDAILEQCNRENAPECLFTQFGQIHTLFGSLTREQCLKYPLACLQYIYFQTLLEGEPGGGSRCRTALDRMEAYITASDFSREYKDFLLGETCVVRAAVVYNDIDAMALYSRKAAEYFSGGCSCIVTRCKPFTFGSPHLLYCYYREKGGMLAAMRGLVENSEILSAPTDGCGSGCDAVAQAEYLLEIGDFEHMEPFAYKAIYKARVARQTSLTLCARFALARLEILRGKNRGPQGMEPVREEILREKDPVLNTALDLCSAYLSALLGRSEELPSWISSGDLSQAVFLKQGRNFYYNVRAKVLLLNKEYLRLEAECEMAQRMFERHSCQLGLLHNFLYLAAARQHLQGLEAGCAVLEKALAIGQADGIVMPFIENAQEIGGMLEHLRRKNSDEPSAYLEKLVLLGQEYRRRVEELKVDMVTLTDREQEVLQLLSDGFKHEEIGAKLFISVTTVRYHIKNIYRKLGVNNRVLAIQKAQKLKLLS